MEVTRVLESAWFHNLNKIMTAFIKNPKASLTDCYKHAAKNPSIEAGEGLKIHFYYSINTLTFELLALTTEIFQKDGINFADPKINKLIKELKQNLPQEYQTLNGAEFLKLVRQSISHNSETKQNFKQEDLNNYKVNLPKKNVGNPATYDFSTIDLIKILQIYDMSKIQDKHYGQITVDENYDTPSMLLYGKKKLGSFNKFIEFKDVNGNVVPMDQFQENAFQRFLIKDKHNINKYGNMDKFMARFFPLQNNKLNNYEHKSHLLMSLQTMFSSDKSITCEDMIKHVKKHDSGSIMHFVDPEFMKSVIYSSIAFNMFSSHTNEELAELFEKSQVQCDNDTIRHLRNSFVHGRYFYNYKDSFEIYDGTKQMEHITTFPMENIDKLFATYSAQTRKDITKERIKQGYDKIK